MKEVIVFGGYGTFGAHVCRALARRGISFTVAGRNLGQAEAFARGFGPGSPGAAFADLTRADSCRAAVQGHKVAVNFAGPFQGLDATLLEVCLEAGCHYADITDDRGYAALVRAQGPRFQAKNLAAVYGCSSLPGISGALALLARSRTAVPVQRARVTLFIGNNNPKGQAAVHSLLSGLGRPISAPQGMLRGFRDREVVPLPAPFGRRGVFNFEGPEYDLFPALLGTPAVSVKLGFELRMATYTFALMAFVGSGYGGRTARLLKLPGRVFQGLGCSGGAVMTELFLADGSVRRAAIGGASDGQRLAALPCALAASALSRGELCRSGAATVYDFLGASALLQELVQAGFPLHTEPPGLADEWEQGRTIRQPANGKGSP